MAKPLTQITFSFEDEQENPQTVTPVEEIQIEVPRVKSEEKIVKKEKTASTRGRRSLKDAGINNELLNVPEDEVLFQKQYYSIGEVALMFRENQSLIRYWETEF